MSSSGVTLSKSKLVEIDEPNGSELTGGCGSPYWGSCSFTLPSKSARMLLAAQLPLCSATEPS